MLVKLKYIILACAFLGPINFIEAQVLTPIKTTICWDSSLSMKDRDLEKEFSFLEIYFRARTNVEVTLLIFSNTVVSKEQFNIDSGQWGLLKNRLADVFYDGGTSFSGLSELAGNGDILLFTDGYQNINNESPLFQANLMVVNSKDDYNQANLNLLTILSSGTLVNLAKRKKQDSEGLRAYYGSIQGTGPARQGIEISLKNAEDQRIQPEEDGSYSVMANIGDVLVVKTRGGQYIEKELGESKNIDIWIDSNDQIRLEEVVLTGIREEPVEEKLTAYGDKNADEVGYAVQSITDDQILEISSTVNNAVQGKFSGMRLGQNDDLSQAILRPSNSVLGTNYSLIVVDGVPLRQSNSATGEIQSTAFLDPNNIAKITVLKGLAATNRFGSMGANGVILITTKTANVGKSQEYRDLALVSDNIYEGKLKVSAKTLVTPYLKALKGAKNLEQAYALYLEQRDKFSDSPAFYIDVFEYFRLASMPLAIRVLSNVLEDDSVSYSTLRAMLLKCQQHDLNQLQLETATKILERFPEKIQSYLDYGIALKSNELYQESLDQLLKIADGTANTTLDFSELKKSVDSEIKNLVYNYGRQMNLSKVSPAYRNNLRYDARLVFDWNHQSAEFELQFVNPQKRFFTWEHTVVADEDRMRKEWDLGYAREDFEIIGQESHGEWLVNVNYLGNTNSSDQTPTFLRCIVSFNFGKPDQREEVYLIRLHEKDSEEQFVRITVE